jgi:hypothetical protein
MLKLGWYTFNAGREQNNINIQWDCLLYLYVSFNSENAQRIVIKFGNRIIFQPLIDWLNCGPYYPQNMEPRGKVKLSLGLIN